MRWTLFAAILLTPIAGRADELLGNSVKRGDVYVEISKACVSEVPLLGPGDKVEPSDKRCLMLFVGILNYSKTKELEYRGWAADLAELDERVVVRDDLGNTYRRVRFGDRKVRKQYPGGKLIKDALLDLLVFEKPSDQARELRVTLAGSQVGWKEDVQINLPVQRTASNTDPSDVLILYDVEVAVKEFRSKGVRRAPGERPDVENRRRDEPEDNGKPEAGKRPPAGKMPEAAKKPGDNATSRATKKDAKSEKARISKANKAALERRKEERDERSAASQLRVAEILRKAGDLDSYRKKLEEIVDKYPETESGKKAAKLLE